MEISCVVVTGDVYVRVLLRNITDRMNTYVSKMGFIGLTHIMWAGWFNSGYLHARGTENLIATYSTRMAISAMLTYCPVWQPICKPSLDFHEYAPM